MKYLLLILLFATELHAEKAPAYLKGGSVTQHLNGRNSKYSSEDVALVKRENLGKYKKLYFDLVRKGVVYETKYRTVTKTRTVFKANMVFLHLGVGNNGVTVKQQGEAIIVEEKKVPSIGLSYARHLAAGFYAGVSGFSNADVTGNIGYSW